MKVIVIQAFGVLVFLVGSILLASIMRRTGNSRVAENASRISHALFWIGLVLPGAIGLFHPGLTAYDELFGIPSLPVRSIKKGKGTAAFLLTEQLVTDGLYGRTRNPMSLGFYAVCVGLGMIAGSLTVTLGALFIILPVHLINLKYFEERELELRYGYSYVDYKQRVPFLIPRFKHT
jgi:protein-S-isoprenylcysteine O-methyltransferase Ste14